MDERGEGIEDPDLDVPALEADGIGQGIAVDRGADDRGMDEPDVDVRQPGLPRDRSLGLAEGVPLDARRSASGAPASVIGWSGRLRSWLWVVVKPLTSSPAIPMTTWLGRKPAISSASCSATEQLSTTAAMSATVPDDMWLRPWRLRPTPRTVPWPSSPISKTSALANSVPMSSAVQAARASFPSRCQIRRRKATR